MNPQFIAISAMVIIGLGLVNSVHGLDPQHFQHLVTSGVQAMVQLNTFQNIMLACKDLQDDQVMFDKCIGMIDKLNGLLNQTFTQSKADIDEIMKKTNYTQTQGFGQ